MPAASGSKKNNRLAVRAGGFVAGALLLLLGGGLASTAFTGDGLSDRNVLPPQVYTNF